MPDVRLIDANALRRKFIEGDGHDDDRFTEGFNFAAQVYREYIDDAPTIDSQPVKQGHWIRKAIFYVCSECGIELIDDNFEQIAIFPEGYMPFCPNCTAKMEGVKKWQSSINATSAAKSTTGTELYAGFPEFFAD